MSELQITSTDLGSGTQVDPKKEEELLLELKKVTKANHHLKRLSNDEDYLKRYLYLYELNVQRAYDRMLEFCYLLLEFPDWFVTSVEKTKFVLEEEAIVSLPMEDKQGRPVFIMRVSNMRPDKVQFLDIVYAHQVWVEHMFNETEFKLNKNGLCVLIDVKDIPWSLVKWFTPSNITTALKFVEGYPIKNYRFHIVNTSAVFTAILKIIWPFLSEDLRQMIIFHDQDYQKLLEHIDAESLPVEFGGKKEISFEECYKHLLDNTDKVDRNIRKYYSSYII